MPDVSPTKWHRGHTSWFFETFLLQPELAGYQPFHPAFGYIFNSYYEAVGARHPRAERGLISRPGAAEVADYRRHVDQAMGELLGGTPAREVLDLVELGLHHEQQHQELLLMDIKHVLSCNPLRPAYRRPATAPRPRRRQVAKPGWIEHQGGPVEIGHDGTGFAFDNESPRHLVQLDALRPGRPASDLRGVAGLHRRRRVPPPRAVAVRRLGAGAAAAVDRRRSTGLARGPPPAARWRALYRR